MMSTTPRRIIIHSPSIASVLQKTSLFLKTTIKTSSCSNTKAFSSCSLSSPINLSRCLNNQRDYRHYGRIRVLNNAIIIIRPFSTTSDEKTTAVPDEAVPTTMQQQPTATTNAQQQQEQQGQQKSPLTSTPAEGSWVDLKLPISMQPYARLARMDKPIGTMLLLWPCFWSTAIAAPTGSLPDLKLLGLFSVGSFVMRGAGCTINDMWDSDFDKSVSRTKTRPLASGELTHNQASAFLLAQLTAGLGVLLSLPHLQYCFILGSASLPLVFSYPLMKRYTNWPQLVLGLTFNWGAFMGWAAVHGDLDYGVVLPLYASGVAWTIVYDTLYAHQDKKDDAKLGLKSTALHFGENTKPILHTFSTLTFTNWLLVGHQLGYDSWLYYGGCGLAYSHLLWQVQTADINAKDGDDNLGSRFRSNNHVGALVFVSCVAGNVLSTTVV